MKKLLIFYFVLFFSCNANAQFGDILKGLEKIAKELGGDNQQQSQTQQESKSTEQAQNTSARQDDDDSNFIKNYLIGVRWNQERFCLSDSANGIGSFFELDSNKRLNAFLKRPKSTTDSQIHAYEKHTFTSIKIIDKQARIYELQGTAESLITGERIEIIQHIKILNDFTRVTLNFSSNGEVLVRDGKNIKDGSDVLPQVNCEAKEILAKKDKARIDNASMKKEKEAFKFMDLGMSLYLAKVLYDSGKPQWDFNVRYGAPPVSANHIKMITKDIPDVLKSLSPCYKELTGMDLNFSTIKNYIDTSNTKNAKEQRGLIALIGTASVVKAPTTRKQLNDGPDNEILLQTLLAPLFKIINEQRKNKNFCETVLN